jgi:hypothetical protein
MNTSSTSATAPVSPATASADATFDCPGNYIAGAPTTLRCAKCNRPLAVKDAKRTPTGYVCPYYVKARVATFYTAGVKEYALAIIVAFVLGIGVGFVLRLVGSIGLFSLILTIFIGPAAGGLVAEVVRRLVGKNRGQYIWLASAIALVAGSAIFTIVPPLALLLSGSSRFLFALIPAAGVVMAASTLAVRLRI